MGEKYHVREFITLKDAGRTSALAFMRLVLCWCCIALMQSRELAVGEDTVRQLSEAEVAESYVAQMWNSFTALRTGVVRIQETFTREATEGQSTMFLAFDFDRERLRFDRSYRQRLSWYARNDRESLLCVTPLSGGPYTVARGPVSEKIKMDFARPIDIRTVGIASWISYERRESPEEMKHTQRKVWAVPPVLVEDEEEHVLLRYDYGIGEPLGGRFDLKLQKAAGYLPMSVKHYRRDQDDQTLKWSGESIVDWRREADCWVPVRWELSSDFPVKYELLFQWESVNQGVPDRMFELEGLELPADTLVLNKLQGDVVYEGRLNENREAKTLQDVRPEGDRPVDGNLKFKWVVLWINLLLLGALLLAWVIRRRFLR